MMLHRLGASERPSVKLDSIPGFSHLDGGQHGQDSSKGYDTEWEARTNAFQRAKLLLEGPQDATKGHLPERV